MSKRISQNEEHAIPVPADMEHNPRAYVHDTMTSTGTPK